MIKFSNCNNIDHGEINISKNHLNIKYGFNGTGKTTISTAIVAKIRNDNSTLDSLIPFKHKGTDSNKPNIEGIDKFHSVMVFNDDYVNSYVFQKDELIKNSFEIFIRSKDYDKHMSKINELVKAIRKLERKLGISSDSNGGYYRINPETEDGYFGGYSDIPKEEYYRLEKEIEGDKKVINLEWNRLDEYKPIR